jgi:UDP-3-O-[3-hydroxymyristoyl] N-acetylglucosamine deacetylase
MDQAGAEGLLRMRRNANVQKTIADRVTVSGVGVHGGEDATLALNPADPDTGIIFSITAPDGTETEIPALYSAICATDFCTCIGDETGQSVATIEHVMAALMACEIDNVIVEIDSAEVPVMDGSAAPFVDAIEQAGILPQGAPRRFIKVLKPVRVQHDEAVAELAPADSQRFEIAIDFDDPLIGRQEIAFDLTRNVFCDHIARARTFGFMRDVEKLWSAGFALGASLDNTVVLGDQRIVNPEGLRFKDEFVRHKALDAIGDLAMAGAPVIGRFRSLRGGHKLNAAIVSALMADTSAWTYVEEDERVTAPQHGRAEIEAFVSQVAMGPETS